MAGAMKLPPLFGILAILVLPAWARTADPTQPPSGWQDGALAVVGEAEAAAVAPRLQTIVRRRSGKPFAVIDGKAVILGERMGEFRLVHIGESDVVLYGPNGRETLLMSPEVQRVPLGATQIQRRL